MPDAQRETLKKRFKGMMSALYRHHDFAKEIIKECYISYKGKAIMIPGSIFGDGNLKNKSKWIEAIKLKLEELDIIAHKKKSY